MDPQPKDYDYVREDEERFLAALDDFEERAAKEEARRDRLDEMGSTRWSQG